MLAHFSKVQENLYNFFIQQEETKGSHDTFVSFNPLMPGSNKKVTHT